MMRLLTPAAVLSLLLTACASTPGPAAGAPETGRRVATVLQVGYAASFGPWQNNDCRRNAGSTARDNQRYASVQYFSGRHAHLRIVPIDDDLTVEAGDSVIVKIHSCSEALIRIPG